MTEFPIKYTKDGGVVVGQGYADEAPQRAVPAQTEFPLGNGYHSHGTDAYFADFMRDWGKLGSR